MHNAPNLRVTRRGFYVAMAAAVVLSQVTAAIFCKFVFHNMLVQSCKLHKSAQAAEQCNDQPVPHLFSIDSLHASIAAELLGFVVTFAIFLVIASACTRSLRNPSHR